MKFKCGDKLVNVITKETYVLHDFKMVETFNHCCGYELALKKKEFYRTYVGRWRYGR